MKYSKSLLFILLASMVSLSAIAHPGHQHFSFQNLEPYVDLLFLIIPVIIATVVFPEFMNKKIARKHQEN